MTQLFIPPARPPIDGEKIDPVVAIMRMGMIVQGPQIAAFGEEFCAALVLGVRAAAVNSGISALYLGLLAARIGPGDEVIVPSFTSAATANSVAITGATPVLVDTDPPTSTLSPVTAEAAITSRMRVIIPVHLCGHPTPTDALQAIIDAHGFVVLEDVTQAHGASLHGHAAGSFGAFAAFSFYPTKNTTSSEGDMVASSDPEIIHGIKPTHNQGTKTRYASEIVGLNNRMTDIHVVIRRAQLTKVGEWTRARQGNAAFLDAYLRGVTIPHVTPGAMHVYHQHTIRMAEDRDGFTAVLREEHGVGSGVYYPTPNHGLPSLARLAPGLGLAAMCEAVDQVLSLPIYPSLTPNELERIVETVDAFAGAGT